MARRLSPDDTVDEVVDLADELITPEILQRMAQFSLADHRRLSQVALTAAVDAYEKLAYDDSGQVSPESALFNVFVARAYALAIERVISREAAFASPADAVTNALNDLKKKH